MEPQLPGTSAPGAAFVTVAPLYDVLMTGVPYEDWQDYLHQLLKSQNAAPQNVLDLACGTGNVTELLAAQGWNVTGVDIAPDMIAAARQKAESKHLPIAYHVQDAAELTLPGQTFDLCVSLFDSLNYITVPEQLQRAMHRVQHHLAPGALFIFDLNSEYALKNHFFDQNNLGTPERLRYDWTSEYFPQTRLCRVQMKFWYREENGLTRQFEEIHWQFAYRADEIIAMLENAGFEGIHTYQAYTMLPPGRGSDRIFYLARKKA